MTAPLTERTEYLCAEIAGRHIDKVEFTLNGVTTTVWDAVHLARLVANKPKLATSTLVFRYNDVGSIHMLIMGAASYEWKDDGSVVVNADRGSLRDDEGFVGHRSNFFLELEDDVRTVTGLTDAFAAA